MILGKRIKNLRLNLKLKQAELGKILNVSQRTISNWENNIAQPSFELTKKLSVIFNVSIDYLYCNDRQTLDFINQKRNLIADDILNNKDNFITYSIKNLALKINELRNDNNQTKEKSLEIIQMNMEINSLIIEQYENEISQIKPNNANNIETIIKQQIEQIINDKLLNTIF